MNFNKLRIFMKNIHICIIVLLTTTAMLHAVEDMYHQNIRSQLKQQYGITGGSWALYDSERQTNDKMQLINVSGSVKSLRGDEPFSEIIELTVDQIRINPWDNAVRFNTTIPIQKGDALLLIVWMNNIDASVAKHPMTQVFEETASPFTKSLYLDSEVKSGWRQWFIPFKAEKDYPANQARYQLNLGHTKGVLAIAGAALLNFGAQYSIDELPMSTHHLEYDGREDNAPWRSQALSRINSLRKGEMRVRVLNKYDEPVQGANVHVKMLKHKFGFGTAVSVPMWFDDSYDSRIYRQKLENLTGNGRSFNIVVIENALKWPAWENAATQGTREQVVQAARWLADRGIKVRGHNLLWPNWEYMPQDMQEHKNDAAYLQERVQGHIYEQVRYNGLKGIIDGWDVINEMGICHDLTDALGSDQIYADVLKWTKQADPKSKLYLNENDIITDGGLKKTSRDDYKLLIEKMDVMQAPLDGIGVQGHMNTSLTPPEKILEIFDEFKAYNVDISITEYDAVGVNEELAADYMRDILIAAFSHESVNNFIMWGFWDGAHWKNDSPIFRQDWSVKPSGRVFIDWVFHKWWTETDGESNKNGVYKTNAFYGDYSVKVDFDGEEAEALVDFTQKGDDIILHLNTEYTTRQTPDFYRLAQNYPNPFNGATTIEYELPFRDQAKVELFDVTGRRVLLLVDARQPAGKHILQVDAQELPSGLYYYRLQSGKFRQTKKMLLIR